MEFRFQHEILEFRMHIQIVHFRVCIKIVHFRVCIQIVHFRAQISHPHPNCAFSCADFVRGFRPYVVLAGVSTLCSHACCDALYCVYHWLAVNPCFLAALALSTLSL